MTQRVLTRLAKLNRTVVFLVVAVFVFLSLVLPPVIGGWLLLALAAGLAWLLAQTWPTHPPRTRAPRLVILAGLVLLAMIRLIG